MFSMKICILLVVLSALLAVVVLVSTNFCRFRLLYGADFGSDDNDDKQTQSDGPMAEPMNSSLWRLNGTQGGIRATQSELMRNYINSSVDPCDDFYEYACGNWEQVNPIPKDKWQYSTIQLLHQNLENHLRELLSQPIEDATQPSAIDKAKIYYKSCIDERTAGERGREKVLEFIKELGGWPVLDENWSEKNFDWLQLAVKTSFIGNGVIIAYEVDKNPTISTEYSIFLKQTSLGMTNRDNYLKEENSKNLEAYRNLIEKVLRLLDVDEEKALNVSKEIVNFEIKLANATLPPEAIKTEVYRLPTLQQLQEAYSYIDWHKYFSQIQQTNLTLNQSIVIQLGVKYYTNLYYVLVGTENHTMANYMVWRSVLFVLVALEGKFREAWSDFNAAITGQVEPVPLWKICVNQINWFMGMTTSGMFVRKYFDESSKNETIEMINTLKKVFDENLLELEWLDAKTKAYASKKANAMKVAAGYPDYILSDEALNKIYKDVDIVDGKHFENCLAIVKFYMQANRALLSKPFNVNRWIMPPTMVNALYDTGVNRILVLAGLLQPPVFHKHFPQSLNYGGMGMFMGHEIIHGFDDMGRKFDVDGNPLSWWEPSAILEFEERQKCFLEQYENFSKDDQTFKSIATISENLADNGGLRLAYKAYLKWKETNIHPRSTIVETFSNIDLNEDQLFFLSFAQLFCAALRPEAVVESKSYEAHSPQKYRVLGALVNFEKFSEVYGCPMGSRMNPNEKCRLW